MRWLKRKLGWLKAKLAAFVKAYKGHLIWAAAGYMLGAGWMGLLWAWLSK